MDLTNRDYEGYKNSLISKLKEKIPSYTDFSDNDAGMVLLQHLAYQLDKLSYYNDRVEQNLHLETAQTYTAKVGLANHFNYKIRSSVPCVYKQVAEIAPHEIETTILKKGDIITTEEVNDEDKIIFEVLEDLVIPSTKTGLEKDDAGNYMYFTKVVHGYSKNKVPIGSSNGDKYQLFKIDDLYVIEDSIKVYIYNGTELEEWTYVENFVKSHSKDKHFTIIFDGIYYYIKFGSGVLGSIPPIFQEGIVVDYRKGGGKIGNVGINKITMLESIPARLIQTFNVDEPIQYGNDIENLDNIDEKVPAFNRTMERAVHLKDYEDIGLLKLEYVNKVKAVRGVLNKETKVGFNTIDLYILLNNMKDIPDKYMIKLNEFYDSVKMVNTTVNIHAPNYLPIDLNVIVWLPNNVKKTDVLPNIYNYVDSYFELGKKDFGQEFIESEMIVDMMAIPNVKAVNVSRNDSVQPNDTQIITKGKVTYDIRGGY